MICASVLTSEVMSCTCHVHVKNRAHSSLPDDVNDIFMRMSTINL